MLNFEFFNFIYFKTGKTISKIVMDFGGLGLNHVGIFGFGVDCVVKDLIIDSIDLISKAPQSAFLFGYAKNCTFENILIRNTNDGNNSLLFNVPFFNPNIFL